MRFKYYFILYISIYFYQSVPLLGNENYTRVWDTCYQDVKVYKAIYRNDTLREVIFNGKCFIPLVTTLTNKHWRNLTKEDYYFPSDEEIKIFKSIIDSIYYADIFNRLYEWPAPLNLYVIQYLGFMKNGEKFLRVIYTYEYLHLSGEYRYYNSLEDLEDKFLNSFVTYYGGYGEQFNLIYSISKRKITYLWLNGYGEVKIY